MWNRGRLGCGLFYDGSVYEGGELAAGRPGSATGTRRGPASSTSFKPDVALLLVGAWDILDREVDGQLVKFGTVEYDTSFLQQLDDATTLLASHGREGRRAHHAVLLAARARRRRPAARGPSTTRGASTASTRSTATSSPAIPGRYTLLDLNKFVSPQGKFTDALNGVR